MKHYNISTTFLWRFVLLLCFISPLITSAQVDRSARLSIYFEVNQDEIDATAQQLIRSKILEIGPVNLRQIYVEGFTDTSASNIYNAELAERRAFQASQFLLSQGVKTHMIKQESFGESKSHMGSDKENRRVDLTFLYVSSHYFSYGKKPYVIKAQVFDEKSKKPIGATAVLEVDEGNRYLKTNRKGIIILDNTHVGILNVSRRGYLNASFDVIKVLETEHYEDTLFLKIHLSPIQVVEKMRFPNIIFHTDSDKFRPEAEPELIKLLALLKTNTTLYIEIQGHMNFPKSRKTNDILKRYNYDLSYRRAKAVYEYLVKNGIKPDRLTYKGRSNFNMLHPTPQNRSQEDQNKRVEIWKLKLR